MQASNHGASALINKFTPDPVDLRFDALASPRIPGRPAPATCTPWGMQFTAQPKRDVKP